MGDPIGPLEPEVCMKRSPRSEEWAGVVSRRVGAHEWVWVPLCYLVLGLIFCWPAVWLGMVPLPLMNPYVQPDPVWSAFAPPGVAQGANLLLGDVSGFYYPYLVFSIASLRSGIFPLWNPYLFGGVPYFAANQAALLYPINLLCFWLGPHRFWLVAALLRLLIAGCGTYALVRWLGAGRLGALLGGGVYIFAAFNVVWLHFAIHNVAALLPLGLWLLLRLIEWPNRWTALALAGVVAAQLLGGHPETSVFFMVVSGAFVVAWLVPPLGWGARIAACPPGASGAVCGAPFAARAGLIGLALALGLGLAAVQWVPTLELIGKSTTLEDRSFAARASHPAAPGFAPLGGVPRASWSNLRHWLLLVAPELWGSPRGVRIRNWLPERTNYNELASYVGLVTLPLALAGALRGRNRRAGWFFGAMLLLALLLLYPLPGLYRIGYLPLLDVAYGFRFGLGVALAAAVLAGMGLDWLLVSGPRARWGVVTALVLLAALNLAVVYDLWGGRRIAWALGFAPDARTRAEIATVYNPANLRLFVPAGAGLSAALVLAAARSRRALHWAGGLVVAIAVSELVVYGFGYNGFTPPDAIYPPTAAIARLQRDPALFRVLNLDGALWANSAMTHGLQVTGGLDDLVPANQQRFLKRGMAGIVQVEERQVVLDWGQRLMDLMNARYVLSSRAVVRGPNGPAFPLELRDGDVRVYRNDAALPRAYAAMAVVQATARTAEDAVFDPQFDPQQAVVVEEPPPPGLQRFRPWPAPSQAQRGTLLAKPGSARRGVGARVAVTPVPIVEYTPNRVVLAPHLPAPAVVVLADSYDPDWQVTVDGRPARLLRANAMFRGVVVPAGAHRVVFSYRPRMVGWGLAASGAALAGCLLLALWPWRPLMPAEPAASSPRRAAR